MTELPWGRYPLPLINLYKLGIWFWKGAAHQNIGSNQVKCPINKVQRTEMYRPTCLKAFEHAYNSNLALKMQKLPPASASDFVKKTDALAGGIVPDGMPPTTKQPLITGKQHGKVSIVLYNYPRITNSLRRYFLLESIKVFSNFA